MQKLNLPEGKTMEVDRVFRDSRAGRPAIAMRGNRFFYMDGKQVNNLSDLDIVPEEMRPKILPQAQVAPARRGRKAHKAAGVTA